MNHIFPYSTNKIIFFILASALIVGGFYWWGKTGIHAYGVAALLLYGSLLCWWIYKLGKRRSIIRTESESDQLQKQLADLQTKYDAIEHITQAGSWDLDIASGELRWTKSLYHIFGLDPGKAATSYEEFLTFVHPDDREKVNKAYAESVGNKTKYHIIHRIQTRNNELKYIEEYGITLYSPAGVAERSIGTAQDITTKVETNEQLKLKTKALDVTAASVLITDANGKIVWANKAFESLSGYSAGDSVGKYANLTNSGKQDPRFYQSLWNTILSGHAWSGELVNKRADGSYYVIEQTITPILNEGGKTTHFIAVQIDITERRKSQETIMQMNHDLLTAYDATIEGWVRILDLRNEDTEGHTQRVTNLTLEIAQEFSFSKERLLDIRRGALLHDIGKIVIPDHILLKPGPLNEEELTLMRKHTEYAYEMLKHIDYLKPALEIPYSHHEKWDGSGYPLGLRGTDIPLPARIFSIVDVWDALTYDRPYRRAMSHEQALAYLKSQSGIHFDPDILPIVLKRLEKMPKQAQPESVQDTSL